MKTLYSLLLFMLGTSLAIAQDAETAAGVYNDGLALLKAKEYSQALDKMLKAIELADPEEDAKVLKLAKGNGAIAAYYAGNADMKNKDMDAAMSKYEKGLELNPGNYTCKYGIAKVLDEKGMTVDAITAYFDAADAATAAGKGDRGEKYLDRAANMVGTTFSDKKFDDAIAAGEAYLARGESHEVRYYVAKSLIEQGKGAEALAHAEKAKELGGSEDEGKYLLVYAEALEASGNTSAAATAYKAVPQGKYYEHAQYKAGQL